MLKIIEKIKWFLRTRKDICPYCYSKIRVPKKKIYEREIEICSICNNCWIDKDGFRLLIHDQNENDWWTAKFLEGFFGDD